MYPGNEWLLGPSRAVSKILIDAYQSQRLNHKYSGNNISVEMRPLFDWSKLENAFGLFWSTIQKTWMSKIIRKYKEK